MQGAAGAALRCSHLAPAVRTRRATASVGRCTAGPRCSGAAERKETARSAPSLADATPSSLRAAALAAGVALPGGFAALPAHGEITRGAGELPQQLAQLAEAELADSPVSGLKTVVAVLLIVFIIIQGPKGEGMINSLNESRMLGNFSQTKNFVTVGTWGLVGAFLTLSAVVALKH